MNKKYLLVVAASTLMFTACGDDVTEVNEIHQDGMAVLEAGEKLSEQACDTANVGEMLFVMDSSAAFVCDGKSWQTLKGEKGEDGGKGDSGKDGDNGTGCTSKSVKNKSGIEGVEVTCGETVIDTIWNGKDGENGKPGDPGKPGDAGTSCTAKSVKNKSGIEGLEVTCGETVIDTIWNGKDGKDGEDGDNGTSCTAKSVKNKSGLEGLEVTCGETVIDTIWNGKNGQNGNNGTSCIAEPVKNAAGLNGLEVTCGETVVDTIWNGKDGQNGNNGTSCTATVNQDGGFDLVCDGQTVGTIKNGEDGVGCTLNDEGDGKVTVSCGKGSAMTTTILYKAVCGTKPYDPAKSFCSEDTLYSCDDKPYDPAKSFCSEGTLYSCGDKPYDPAKSFCSEGEAYDLCDGKTYDPKTQYCEYDEIAEYQCNGKIYDSRTHYCVGDRIEPNPQCNGISYFPGLYYCKNAKDITPFGYVTASRKNKKLYKTIEIGEGDETQVWVAENIDVPDSPKETNLCNDKLLGVGGSRPIPFDTLPSCFVFGSLYDFSNAVADENCKGFMQCINTVPDQGLCPIGFHLPDTTEWKKLFLTAEKYAKELKGGDVDVKDVSRMLRSTHGWNYEKGTNSFGLDVYPTGYSVSEDWVIGFLNTVYYWTATEVDEAHALDTEYGEAHVAYFDYQEYRVLRSMKTAEVAIRCVKD